MPNAVTDFLRTVGEALAEVGDGALADIRNTWEETWFGRAITPEHGSPADPLGRVDVSMEMTSIRVDTTFNLLVDELAKERCGRGSLLLEHDHELDR